MASDGATAVFQAASTDVDRTPNARLATGPLLGGTSYTRVRDVIRQDIVAGVLGAGDRLKAADLASRYGVSPVPVREALQQLQGEGLVDIRPNRGASVRRIDAKFLQEIFEIREALAGMLAARAAKRITPAIVAQLEGHEAEFEAALERGDLAATLRANGAFHRVGYAAAGNAEALAVMDRHLVLIQTLRLKVGFSPARDGQMISEHRAVLESLRGGRAWAAARHARRHIRSSHEDLLRRMSAHSGRSSHEPPFGARDGGA